MAGEVDDGAVEHTDDERPEGPLVFISHDSRDAQIAEAFCTLLSNVSAGMLQTFHSSDKKGLQGFEFGVEWYPELMKRLDMSCDVVCLLTKRSLNRPWLLYEAGVAKGKLDVPVHGLALGVPLSQAGSGPFAQFQNCDDDVDSIAKLVVQLVKRLPHASPNQTLVRGQVEEFIVNIKDSLAEEDDDVTQPGMFGDDSTAKLFEEVKVMFQDLPSRLERLAMDSGRERRPRMHPKFLDELLFDGHVRELSPGTAALIICSPFRDDIPWFYEMAAAVYEAELSGSRPVVRRAAVQLFQTSEWLMRGPFFRELLMMRNDSRILHELPMMIERFVARPLGTEEFDPFEGTSEGGLDD